MKQLSALKNKLYLIVAAVGAMLFATNGASDDLKIYTTVSNGTNSAAINHNILFVVDTSGSMGWAVAGLASEGNYDPAVNYPGGSNDKDIYIYDTNKVWTGKKVTEAQNKCSSLIALAANTTTSYPLISGQGIQWQTTSSTEIEEECTNIEPPPTKRPIPEAMDSRGKDQDFRLLEKITVSGGEIFTINLSTNKDIKYWIETRGGGVNAKRYCGTSDPKQLDKNKSKTCSKTVRNGHTELNLFIRTTKNGTNTIADGEITSGPTKTCKNIPVTNVTSTGWKTNFITTADEKSIFDCKSDSGVHGLDISTINNQVYVTDCPFGDICADATYSDDSTKEINWSASGLNLFVPGNYHDYLQNGGTVDLSDVLSEPQDAETYCAGNTTSRNNDKFIDGGRPADLTATPPDPGREGTTGVYQCFVRMEVMKDAATNMVNSLSDAPINIGLMRFNSGSGGTLIDKVEKIEDNKADFLAKLQALPTAGGTPLSESLYEAYRYYSGQSKFYGNNDIIDSSALTNGIYTSPITDSCQSNNIILLTDGEPSSDTARNEDIRTLAGVDSCLGTYANGDPELRTVDGSDDGICLDEMAKVLATQDMNTTTVNGINTVKTFTIGLALDLPLMQDTAYDGGSEAGKGYFVASSLSDLEDAFNKIVVDILTSSSSFVAPAVSVNAFNELQNRNEVYYALFQPAGSPRWPGNVKKYKLDSSGNVKDANNQDAVDPTQGFFADTATSIWSAGVDGKTVTLGGVANKLDAVRNFYTDKPDNSTVLLESTNYSDFTSAQFGLTTDAEKNSVLDWLLGKDVYDFDRNGTLNEPGNFLADPLHSRPIVITYGGTASAPKDVLFFATNLGTLHAVDPADDKGTELWAYLPKEHQDNPLDYIAGTDGTQHTYGLDGEMTIIATENVASNSTLVVIDDVKLYIGERRGGSRYYGLDVSNARPDTPIDNSYTTPFLPLFTITGAYQGSPAKTANPDGALAGFSDLGQTWSKMIPAKINIDDGDPDTDDSTQVLVFSGGYDPRHDDVTYGSTNPIRGDSTEATISDYGNAIYIVRASDGALLHSIGNNADDNDIDTGNVNPRNIDQHHLPLPMQNAIPASPTVIDVDGDGRMDMIFAVDIKGVVWRIDINDSAAPRTAGFATGGIIADLTSTTELRRFYNSIDASPSDRRKSEDYINLVVGAGYRPDPSATETWQNRLYFLVDNYPKPNRSVSDETDRYNYASTTSDGVTTARPVIATDLIESTNAAAATRSTAPYGFYTNFSSGEKALQKSITFNNTVLISTFVNSGGVSNACGGSLGSGRAYAVDIATGLSNIVSSDPAEGQAAFVLAGGLVDADGNAIDDSGAILSDKNGEIRFDSSGNRIFDYYDLKNQGIPAESTLLLLPELAICIGTECNIDLLEDALLNGFTTGQAYRSFWQEK